MRDPIFATDHFYHIYNRGVEKRLIFLDRKDQLRFLDTLNYYRFTPQPMKLSDYRRRKVALKKIDKQIELVQIYSYCLMPNHFHLAIQQLCDGGITWFMKQVLNSYTRYFNTKYQRVGALLQGVFKAKLVESDEYMLQLSKYIHRNPLPPERWENELEPLSSYYYYLSGEGHSFCDIQFILSYFSNANPDLSYKNFVEDLGFGEDLGLFDLFIDIDE